MNADSQILYNYAVTTRRKQLSYYFSIKGKHVNSEQISNLYIVFTITFMNKYAHSQLKKIHYFSPIKKKKGHFLVSENLQNNNWGGSFLLQGDCSFYKKVHRGITEISEFTSAFSC